MKRILLLAIVPLLLLASCDDYIRKHYGDKMIASWKFQRMNGSVMNLSGADTSPEDLVGMKLRYGYLHLYSDRKYTFIGENISVMHSWSFNRSDSLLVIDSFVNNEDLRFKVLYCDADYLSMYMVAFGRNKTDSRNNDILFRYDPYFENAGSDLLIYPRNRWRIKPDHKESHAEIRKRVLDHLNFMIAYYQMIEDKHWNAFAPMYLQTVVKFYQNGIAIQNEEYMGKKWESCFYDHDDALQGRKILVDALNGIGTYPEESTYTAGYLKALKQMKDFLEKVN